MKQLIIYSHPNPKSFNHAIFETIKETMEKRGDEVRVRDLHAIGFHPVLKGADFESFAKGETPADIKEEQDHIRWADVVTLIAPVWWFGMPAILKGYIDRVFSMGFAYKFGANGPEGLLTDKKAFMISTTGGPEQNYIQMGMDEALLHTMDIGTFEFCGMKMLGHKFFYAVPTVDDAARKAMLAEAETLLESYK